MKIRTIKTKIFLPRENLLTFIERYVRLAAAAVLCMGEGRERCPLALISNAPINYVDRVKKNELHIDIKEDMYGPLFRRFNK